MGRPSVVEGVDGEFYGVRIVRPIGRLGERGECRLRTVADGFLRIGEEFFAGR